MYRLQKMEAGNTQVIEKARKLWQFHEPEFELGWSRCLLLCTLKQVI